MNAEHMVFLQPQDLLFLRGNKLFGDPGSYGESLVPPWPSVAAGALRSRLLADDASLSAEQLQQPEQFTLTAFHLARRDRQGRVEPLYALPADLVVQGQGAGLELRAMQPQTLAAGLASSAPLERLPVLAEGAARAKISSGWWLGADAWARYQRGQLPRADQLLPSARLWKLDPRVGVGLSPETGRADDGKLFTVQAVALSKAGDPGSEGDVGFIAAARAPRLPSSGLLRLGGDGRAVQVHPSTAPLPEPDFATLARIGRFKLVLTAPGLFPAGWRLPGLSDDGIWSLPGGVTARVVCAAVPRADVISGWDLAAGKPKTAQRAAPTGSVYWLDAFNGSADDLRKLSKTGLWRLGPDNADPQREAEGYNRCALAAWSTA